MGLANRYCAECPKSYAKRFGAIEAGLTFTKPKPTTATLGMRGTISAETRGQPGGRLGLGDQAGTNALFHIILHFLDEGTKVNAVPQRTQLRTRLNCVSSLQMLEASRTRDHGT